MLEATMGEKFVPHSRHFWKRYGLENCYSAIPFVQLIASGELCHDSFLAYEANDTAYLRSFLACWGVVLMKLIVPASSSTTDVNNGVTTVLDIIRTTADELRQVYGNAEHTSETMFLKCQPFIDYIKLIDDVALEKDCVEDVMGNKPSLRIEDSHYAVLKLITVLTPCARLYAEIGKELKAMVERSRRYDNWTKLYAAEDFLNGADAIDTLLDEQIKLAAEAGGIDLSFEDVDEMVGGYYKRAMELELDIFSFYGKLGNSPPKIIATPAPLLQGAADRMPQVLILAGSDSGGGAGIQADMKTMERFNVYSSVAITATTAQNTLGVQDVYVLPTKHFEKQMESCLTDFVPHLRVVKSGMLPNREQMESAMKMLQQYDDTLPSDEVGLLFVCDPVMVSTSGHRLIDDGALESLTKLVIPRSTILTPNLPELAALIGQGWSTEKVTRNLDAAARLLLDIRPQVLLVKGGHDLEGIICEDPQYVQDTLYFRFQDLARAGSPAQTMLLGSSLLPISEATGESFLRVTKDVQESVNCYLKECSALVEVSSIEKLEDDTLKVSFRHSRVTSEDGSRLADHGTGCTLASALASCLALALHRPNSFSQKFGLLAYCSIAIHFVVTAMKAATEVKIGNGHGPLLHCKGEVIF